MDRRDFLRAALAGSGLWALAGCGGGSNAPEETRDPTLVNTTILPFSKTTLAGIRAHPETFLTAYSALGSGSSSAASYVKSRLGAPFASITDAGCMATYAALVAFECAPTGNNALDPLNSTMRQILDSALLTCGHYCKLTTLLSLLGHPELIPPDAPVGGPDKPTLHFVVWLEHVPLGTGVHAQLIIANVLDDAYLLLDPTYGYALRIPFVGSGPQADLTVIENAVTMMQTPIAQSNVAVLDAAGPAQLPKLLPELTSGAIGPQYIYHDVIYGSEGWDLRIAQIFDGMGLTASAIAPRPRSPR